ncbi:M48 family metalloprotease [bacterium SCSIO 12696]|nr:M48 family metalloprotease [bacterium SCSIO 12696]
MSDSILYPESPSNVPEGLTKAKSSYKRQAWLAMAGLMLFMLVYIALAACFGLITYNSAMTIKAGDGNLGMIVVAVSSLLLTVFMIKALFSVRKSGNPGGVEVTSKEQPELFAFLHRLADEVGAPKPHRVFITPEVNAAVFYDLSLLNLIFPSKKNLIVGLGLVNVLNLGELKAVLAHEFGHFAQNSMMVGRWVYIAQQIIAHMVATRDWLDSIIRFISRIDLRIAWIGWILALVIWSIRSLMDTLFRLVVIAERALSREMEFNADLVAVSVTGSDALIHALHKLQAADDAWQTALDVAGQQAGQDKLLTDLFAAQKSAISAIGHVLDDDSYGTVPQRPENQDAQQHRVFTEDMARPPQMWSTHPANRDREDNAKSTYIPAKIDDRDAWQIFANPEALRQQISMSFYNPEKISKMEPISPADAVSKRFSKASYSPEYRGTYLSRSPVRNFATVDDMLNSGTIASTAAESIADLYPPSLADQLELARNLDLERHTLEALARGDLKPSGGVIRHRGKELKKSQIPDAIQEITAERKIVADQLKVHDANCRRAHLQAAEQLGGGWKDYLLGLIKLLHCAEHLSARVDNEQALFVNTWNVITADGQIGHFEKKRMLRVCKQVQDEMRTVSACAVQLSLPQAIIGTTGIENWAEQCPQFEMVDVNKKNWGDWCQAASEIMGNLSYALTVVQSAALEELISTESKLAKHLTDGTTPDVAPTPANGPAEYPVLLKGDEHTLQRKLDLWNRFQLAHGVLPTALRLIVSLGIVGGTVYGGFVGV